MCGTRWMWTGGRRVRVFGKGLATGVMLDSCGGGLRLEYSLANLDKRERHIVGECLRAAVKGPFFPDWEFETIFGLEREEVGQVLSSWPNVNETEDSVVRAINNSM